jgi:hypothetical protein
MGIDARPQEETSFHYSQQQTTLFKVEYWTIMCIEREREKQRERERERERESLGVKNFTNLLSSRQTQSVENSLSRRRRML